MVDVSRQEVVAMVSYGIVLVIQEEIGLIPHDARQISPFVDIGVEVVLEDIRELLVMHYKENR